MNFANLSAGWVVAGIAGLAALLYALQRLRVRHRQVTVVTTLFWRVAAEEAPARRFVERFRHPWAYALILLIVSLLWLAFAGPQLAQTDGGSFHVLVLDGSAGMAAGSRYQDAVAALKNQVRHLAADQRQVVWSGGGVRTLLNPGEHELLLEKRLAGLAPEAAPAGVENLLRQLGASSRPGRATDVVIFGDAPVRPESLALSPNLSVARAPISTRQTGRNTGITALGVAEAESGAWDRVDVFVRVENDQKGAAAPDALRIDLDGRDIPATELRAVRGDAAKGFLLQDLPAAGGLLTVRLTAEDSLPLDNVARIRLPDKPKLKVQLSPSLDRVLRLVLAADPAIQITEAGAKVVIRKQGENVGASLPALEFVMSQGSRPAFLITHPAKLDSTAVFNQAVKAIGLKEIDAMSLAQTARRPVEVTVGTGPQWRIEVWQELLSEEFNFTRSRAFPLFIANSVRWLADTRSGYPFVAAGRPLASETLEMGDRVVDGQGRMLDPLGVPFVPERAGEIKMENSARPLAVSLLDPASTVGLVGAASNLPQPGSVGLATNPVTWLLVLALGLLGVEWYLYQTSRVP
ncbi:MAG: hypothetical protein EXS32_02780 [Opitutus sp.]|nr:hypothetical protein [Opitutus sp.]